MAPFIAAKGSVTLDGVSLTVNSVENRDFTVNIIPHTQDQTTLGGLAVGMAVKPPGAAHLPTYPTGIMARPAAERPTYPPSGAEFRERPPSGRAQRYLPTLARCLPAPRPYLPTLAQVFPIAAVTYLPGQRDATLHAHAEALSRRSART